PHGPAAGLPGVVVVLPGLGTGLAGRRHGVFAPQHFAGRAIERGNEIAHSTIAAGSADHDLVLDGQRRRRERQFRVAVAHVGFPGHLAGLFVGGDDARRIVGDTNHEISPQRSTAVYCQQFLLTWVHAPDDPAHVAGPGIDLVDYAPLVNHVEVAVLG